LLDFAIADLVAEVASLADRRDCGTTADGPATVAEWFRLGVELEAKAPAEAREAYRRALALDAGHADANVNLGRLLHEAGRPAEAALHYRRALAGGADATASYNLGVALEDLHRPAEARAAYAVAIETNPELADAHYNLASLCERLGDGRAALRHLRRYRELAEHGAGTVR
ncbi:MAG: tetratricopeptide repeat protein, partial [Longimicrobiales bacterium]